MRAFAACLIPAVILAAVRASDGRDWSRPNGAEAGQIAGSLAAADQPTAGVVRLVGQGRDGAMAPPAPARTFAFELPAPGSPNPCPGGDPRLQSVPQDAQWPDARGRILAGADHGRLPRGDKDARNPWEVRAHREGAREEIVITCGGIIATGGAESVAFLNGSAARRGAVIEGLSLARITPDAAVLEMNGSFIVIPRGMRVTVVR